MISNDIRAACFDLDGTLYNYSKCNSNAENKLFEFIESEKSVTRDEAASLLKRSKTETKQRLANVAASHSRLLYFQNICNYLELNPIKYPLIMYDIYWDEFLLQIKLYDWVEEIFRLLKKNNISINILTDLTALIQLRKIKKMGIADYIDTITTSEEAGAEKPSSAFFELALSKIQTERSKVVMFGDDYEKDVIGAQKAGVRSMMVNQMTNKNDIIDFINAKG